MAAIGRIGLFLTLLWVGSAPVASAAEPEGWRIVKDRRPTTGDVSCTSVREAIARPDGYVANCILYDPSQLRGGPPRRLPPDVPFDRFDINVRGDFVIISHSANAVLVPFRRNGPTWRSEGWGRIGCIGHNELATTMLAIVGVNRKIAGARCTFTQGRTPGVPDQLGPDFQRAEIVIPKSYFAGKQTIAIARPGLSPSAPKQAIAKPVAPSVRTVATPTPPAVNPDDTGVADANVAQARRARQQLTSFVRAKRARENAYAAALAAHNARLRARQAEIDRAAAADAAKRAQWEADVRACKAGDRSKCAKPTATIAMIEGVVVCPLDGTKLFGESTCFGPFQNTLSDHRKASDISLACGSSSRPVRDMGIIDNKHVWGCEYGLNPTKPGSPNIDQAARFALVLPARLTFRCPPTIPGYCRTQ